VTDDNDPIDARQPDGAVTPQTAGTIRASLAERLAYLRFDQADADLLYSLQPLVQQHADEIVRAFYEHLIAFDTTRDLLRDEAVMTRLVEVQKVYLGEMFGGIYDERYAERRVAVGRTHDRVGLEPSWYLGAYHLYQRVLFPLVTEHLVSRGAGQGEVNDSLLAITKAMTLDIDLALETYFGAYSEALRAEKERLEVLTDELQGSNAALNDLTERLEDRVRERTSELLDSEGKLRQAEKLATIGKMTSMMAHEIRNPLSSVLLNLELLGDEIDGYEGADTGEARDLLGSVLTQIRRVDGTIREYLAIARTPKVTLALADVNDVVREQVGFMRPEIERAGIQITLDLSAAAPSVSLDTEQFSNVTLNLLKNSMEAMPRGGSLYVSTGALDASVTVRVRDTGDGMTPDQCEQVFQPLYTTKDKGLGMGLAYVQQVVRDHRGDISCVSELGHGTTFTIELPIPGQSLTTG
jgi:signal transduction histidine kinase